MWWLIPVVTSAAFLLWLADSRPIPALAVGVGVAAPMLLILAIAKLIGWLRR